MTTIKSRTLRFENVPGGVGLTETVSDERGQNFVRHSAARSYAVTFNEDQNEISLNEDGRFEHAPAARFRPTPERLAEVLTLYERGGLDLIADTLGIGDRHARRLLAKARA